MSNNSKMKSTLKSDDVEEWLDLKIVRPLGYLWTLFFNKLNVHPNTVTVLSMIIGGASGFFLSKRADTTEGLIYNIIGVLLIMWANLYDSADGQLARMTGKKTRLGRILDGAAGDIWFFSIYVGLAVRLFPQTIPFTTIQWSWWAFLLMAVSGFLCHSRQANLADYYRQAHLFFQKGAANSELDNYLQQQALYDQARWSDDVIWKFFLFTYVRYTKVQEAQTPEFQKLMATVKKVYPKEMPQALRDDFRAHSLPLIKYVNMLSFNTRAIVLYICCLIDMPYIYPLFEIIVLMSMFFHMRSSHEKFCKQLRQNVEAGKY
ncbi:MAG: CDP-alcohol phosphatidyltransferase family protein [Bacteroidaceae bacterium]|nr:CDP-alcohol phosphatidyltransferase family protein [Bacteroidaceae bacterium]